MYAIYAQIQGLWTLATDDRFPTREEALRYLVEVAKTLDGEFFTVSKLGED